jgi:hypothetical protein
MRGKDRHGGFKGGLRSLKMCSTEISNLGADAVAKVLTMPCGDQITAV